MTLPKLERLHKTVFSMPIEYTRRNDWEQWVLLTADHHWDSPQCNRSLIKQHLVEAQERKAPVFMFGDFFDCMQGKYDPRKSKQDIREELRVPDYFDALPRQAAHWLKPFSENISMVSKGNHETSVLKHQEVDLIERLGMALGEYTVSAPYMGWVLFQFRTGGRTVHTHKLRWHHGHGGGGPVTRGVIGTARRAVYLPDADILVQGHTHESWFVEIERERLSSGTNKPYLHTQTHIQLPSYKDDYLVGEGWAVERGMPPKPQGAYWLRFFYQRSSQTGEGIKYEVVRARN